MSCLNSFKKKSTVYVQVTSEALQNGEEKTVPPVSFLKLSFCLHVDWTDKSSSGTLEKSKLFWKKEEMTEKEKMNLKVVSREKGKISLRVMSKIF